MPGHPMTANMPYAPAIARRAGRSRVPASAYWLFIALFLFSILNLGAIYTWLYGTPPVPINPVVFAITAVPILLMTGPKRHSVYFWLAWLFWVSYTLGGFLGVHQATGQSTYLVAQIVFKVWINIIGIPWVALRVVQPEKLPSLVRTATSVVVGGAILSLVQVMFPNLVPQLVYTVGRGAGLWINPNNCGTMCGIGVFLNLMFPFRSKALNFTMRGILICAVVGSLSRSSILAFAICLIVFGLASGRLAIVAKSMTAVLVISLLGALALQFVDTSISPQFQQRVVLVKRFMQGDVSAEQQSSRITIWRAGLRAISSDWLLGRGHGAMLDVIPRAGRGGKGLGPHNYYLYIWGNSGLVALLGMLAYGVAMFQMARRCEILQIRAGMMAIATMFAFLALFTHALFEHQFLGPIFSLFVLIGIYKRRKGRPLFQFPAKGMPPLAHPQLPSS